MEPPQRGLRAPPPRQRQKAHPTPTSPHAVMWNPPTCPWIPRTCQLDHTRPHPSKLFPVSLTETVPTWPVACGKCHHACQAPLRACAQNETTWAQPALTDRRGSRCRSRPSACAGCPGPPANAAPGYFYLTWCSKLPHPPRSGLMDPHKSPSPHPSKYCHTTRPWIPHAPR